jgi:hypothetical protein
MYEKITFIEMHDDDNMDTLHVMVSNIFNVNK